MEIENGFGGLEDKLSDHGVYCHRPELQLEIDCTTISCCRKLASSRSVSSHTLPQRWTNLLCFRTFDILNLIQNVVSLEKTTGSSLSTLAKQPISSRVVKGMSTIVVSWLFHDILSESSRRSSE